MNPERLQRVDEMFQSALDLAPEPRRAFLARVRADDPELHAEVDSLLRAHERATKFIETPAADAAVALFAATPVVTRVGTYTVEAPLGAGGMGEVYRAVDRMGRRVALKTLAPRFVGDPKHVSRFLQEARAVLALNHPNVVTVYDIGEADGVYYIASELIEGVTLRDAMRDRTFTLDALLDIATQTAIGVAAAHDKGIVHRDVKPENVMLRADGFVKVLDFGIAKLTEAFDRPGEAATQTALTREGLVIGTASYMSPEQARGANVDARSDVWSLGVMLYEMVTGELPFSGATPADVIGRILEREPAPLSRFVDAPPDELQAIVSRALSKDAAARFQTMAELVAALKTLRQELAFAAKLERLNVPSRADVRLGSAGSSGVESSGAGSIAEHRPFVFVCYAHADADRVYPHIERLRAAGVELWFDRGIRAGEVWRKSVAEALDRASHLLFFVSPHSLESEHCDPEVQYALDQRKVVIPVFLERTELSPQLRLPLSRVHSLYSDRMSAEALRDALRDAILDRHRTLTATASTPVRSVRAKWSRRILTAAGAAVVAVVIAASWWFAHSRQLPTRSIAVLPFAAMSDDPKMRHLSNALREELLNNLTAERQLHVASSTSSSNRPADQSVPAFAASLGVSYVLEGSIRPTANGIRATAQLIRGRDDVHLLSRTFESSEDESDIVDTAGQIAALVFRYLDNDLDIAKARLETTNDEAFANYERFERLDPSGEHADTHRAGQEQALIYLDKATALDPNFAEPYIERTFFVGAGLSPDAAREETHRLIKKYLELCPDSAYGWTILGAVQWSEDHDLVAGEASLQHARELEPDFPWPLSQLGHIAVRRGRLDEAADYFKQSTMVDHSRPSHSYYGAVLLNLKRFDEAEHEFDLALRVDRSDLLSMIGRVNVAYLKGDKIEGDKRFAAAWAKYGAEYPNAFVTAMGLAGRETQLRDLMKQWDDGVVPTDPESRAWAHLMLGEYDAAIDSLMRAVEQGNVPRWVRAGLMFDALHTRPRYSDLLAQVDATEVTH